MENQVMDNIDEEKNKLTGKLSQQYSHNKISLEEYERLIEYIHKIETGKEMVIIGKIIEENNAINITENNVKKISKNGKRTGNNYTILSSQKTSGAIINETENFISILGDNHIIINENDLKDSETTINIYTILGETVIHIAENISVINKTTPILGGIWVDERINNGRGDGKIIIINGNAILGNITIKVNKDENKRN